MRQTVQYIVRWNAYTVIWLAAYPSMNVYRKSLSRVKKLHI